MKRYFVTILTFMLIVGGLVGAVSSVIDTADAQGFYNSQNTVYAEEGGTYYGVYNETIYYHHKTDSGKVANTPKLPRYNPGSYLTCGPIAGGNIVCWYSRLYPELTPNFDVNRYVLGTWMWATMNGDTAACFDVLYNDMGASSSGVTIYGYLNGMGTYASRYGRSFSYTDVTGSGSTTLNSSYKTALSSEQLMTIFVDGFNTMADESISSYPISGYDKIATEVYSGAHVMAVYGYREILYYEYSYSTVPFRTDVYLYVYDGLGNIGMTRVSSTPNCTLDAAYVTYFY